MPEAFGDKALLFAGSYVAIQVGRTAFLAFAGAHAGTLERRRASQILIWFVAAGVFWIAGALAEGSTRTLLWLIALAIDYGAPAVTYWVPWSGRVRPSAWQVSTAHFAERFQLFVIIALGESIVITGATTAELDLDTGAHGGVRAWPSCPAPRCGGCTSTTWPGSPSGAWSWPRTAR